MGRALWGAHWKVFGAHVPIIPCASETGAQKALPQGPRHITLLPQMSSRVLLSFLPSPPSKVDPPFYLAQKLDLVNAGISCVFSLPLIIPSQDRKESASLYLQVNP